MGKRKKKRKSTLTRKMLVVLSCFVPVLCAASITYGFFLRHAGSGDVGGHPIRIEVLNGTGEKGLAQKAAVALMKKGIDVFKTGNAEHFSYSESVLISRKKNPQFKRLGEALGCSSTVEQLKEGAIVDATLILGADYRKLKLGLGKNSRLLE